MSIHDDLKTVEEDLARGAQVAGEFMLDLVRRARAEFNALVGDAPAAAAPAAPTPEVALADAEPLTDLHGGPVAELPAKAEDPQAGEA